jgi:hypothetical protein
VRAFVDELPSPFDATLRRLPTCRLITIHRWVDNRPFYSGNRNS